MQIYGVGDGGHDSIMIEISERPDKNEAYWFILFWFGKAIIFVLMFLPNSYSSTSSPEVDTEFLFFNNTKYLAWTNSPLKMSRSIQAASDSSGIRPRRVGKTIYSKRIQLDSM